MLEKLLSREFLITVLTAVAGIGVMLGWWSSAMSAEIAAQLTGAVVGIYTFARTVQKVIESKSAAVIEAAKVSPPDPS